MATVETIHQQSVYVGGKWLPTSGHRRIVLPFDGTEVAIVGTAGPGILDHATAAARAGFHAMRSMANYERADLLLRIADLLRRDLSDFGELICCESGKPIREARLEAERSLQTLIASAHEARDLHGEVVPMDFGPAGKGRMAMTVREPRGIVGAITPFNFPLNLAMHKIGPALAAGCSVIHKPAERTPLSALRLARTMEEAGVPAGAYNVITGDGPELGMAMVEHPGIDMITFTGSVRVGSEIRARAGWKHVTLELGNNSAVIVDRDCDVAAAAQRTVQGAFAHSGQICISVQRAFVHRSIADEFLERLEAGAESLKRGHPREESTDVSSLIDEPAAIRVEDWITEAATGGARLVTGGKRTFTAVAPAVLDEPAPSARISCEEAFGPVVAVYRFDDVDNAVARVNATPYGLQAGVFTNDLQRAFHIAAQLRMGGVLINDVPMFRADHMPYGGVKQSGTGREGPRYAIQEMTEQKLICWKV